MVRNKLAIAIAALGVLQANVVSALGMGDFSLQSALNQPLVAEIRLLNASDLDNEQIRITLADRDDFKNAGISREFFLSNFKFAVVVDGKGGGVVKITTRDPVIEPYLNFLVEAHWPSGRLLREYTVLLDLPVFSESGSQSVNTASSTVSTVAAVANPTQVRSASSSSVRKTLASGQLKAGEQYRVRTDDTLWDIAARSYSGSGLTVQQTMMGIQRLNPRAFTNGNINGLKAGSVLRLPTADEVAVISDSSAVGEVASQNRSWRRGGDTSAPSADVQLDATATPSTAENSYTEKPRLSLSAGGDSDRSGDGEGTGGGSQALQNELDQSHESLDKVERDNDELQSRLGDMEEKLATVQRLLELKDDQLAALQGSLSEQNTADDARLDSDAVEDQSAGSVAAVEIEAEVEPKSKPIPAVVAQAEPDLLEELLANPLYLGGAGLAILALVIVLLRRRKGESEEVFELDESLAQDEPIETEQLAAELEEHIAADNEEADTFVEESPLAEPVQAETGDPIAEADIYVAYGRYQQAIDLLTTAIAQEPQRSDLQLKLLEVSIEARDKPVFQQHFLTLQALGDEQAVASVKELLSTVDGVAGWLDDLPGDVTDFSNEEVDAGLIEGLDAETEVDIDLDLDLNDLDLDLDLEDLSSTQETVALELDEDIDLDLSDSQDLDLDLDLGIEAAAGEDVSLDESLAELSPEDVPATEEGFDFELDLDLGEDADLDLSIGDLSDLETEFGEVDDELMADFELSLDEADTPLEDAGEVATEVSNVELSSVGSDASDDAIVEFSTEVATATPDHNESLDVVANTAADGDDFDFLAGGDEVATKLDLARAYIDMGDAEGAKDILDEVVQEGSDEQKKEAGELLERVE